MKAYNNLHKVNIEKLYVPYGQPLHLDKTLIGYILKEKKGIHLFGK